MHRIPVRPNPKSPQQHPRPPTKPNRLPPPPVHPGPIPRAPPPRLNLLGRRRRHRPTEPLTFLQRLLENIPRLRLPLRLEARPFPLSY